MRDKREGRDPKSDLEPFLIQPAHQFLLPFQYSLIMWARESDMALSGHVVGLLKEYMQDLVEQAKQETAAHASFGFSATPYRSDQALSDLLAILDDRIESEGLQVGLPDGFLHQMWGICNDASAQVTERVWLDVNSSDQPSSKARVRELTYRALLAVIEASC
jgi:hypothetical protein